MSLLKNIVSFSKKINLSILFFLTFVFSCGSSGGNTPEPTPVSPSNIQINYVIVGSSTSYPNGDGSGVVNINVSASNATSYKILIGSETLTSTNGSFTYTFKDLGTNSYTIYASAYNGDKYVSTSASLSVYVAPKLVWSDEFDVNGAPDSSKWGYDLGNNSGWGNNELEYYTNDIKNSVVSNGTLKINLIKESISGFNYSSARLLSKGKYSFKYGRVDIRAKIPSGGGTWPALWMLGDNISTAGWPACGEVDIMEHVGNQLNKIFGTLHYPGRSGGNADGNTINISTATTDFHIYSVEWNSNSIKFMVDNQVYHSYVNSATSPFNQNFFLIMNVAMGGNFGGTVDTNVTSATMEVDYVRVYQ